MRRTAPLVLLAVLPACTRAQSTGVDAGALAKAGPRARGVVDTHLHIAPTEIERLHDIMNEVGVSWGLNLSGGWPGGGLEEQLEAARRSGRLVVACNIPWMAARRTDQFPKLVAEMLKECKSLGARALKIEKVLGLRAKKPDGTLLAVDDPWLDPIWTAAGEVGLPVVIHTGDPKAFWLPVDEKNERLEELTAHPGWSNHGVPGLPSFQALLDALMNVVAKHPKTTFVAVHFGNDAEDPEWVGRQLDQHPNLFVDIAARLPEIGRHDADMLHALFTRHAGRILFGTDLGVQEDGFLMLGSFGKQPNTRKEVGPFFAAHYTWFETRTKGMPSPTPIQGRWTIDGIGLADEVLEQIYRKNAERLFGPPPQITPMR